MDEQALELDPEEEIVAEPVSDELEAPVEVEDEEPAVEPVI